MNTIIQTTQPLESPRNLKKVKLNQESTLQVIQTSNEQDPQEWLEKNEVLISSLHECFAQIQSISHEMNTVLSQHQSVQNKLVNELNAIKAQKVQESAHLKSQFETTGSSIDKYLHCLH